MKKTFRFYVIAWALLLVIFNIVCFATPAGIPGYNKFAGAFWAGYIFITIAFVVQLFCASKAFRPERREKQFYRLPLISISYVCLIVMMVLGTFCMAVPDLPNWAGIVLCGIVLLFHIIALLKASAAAELVERKDTEIRNSTQFIRSLTANLQAIESSAKDDETRELCKKVYEAARYSDPVSIPELAGLESEIAEKAQELSAFVKENNTAAARTGAEELLALLNVRNAKTRQAK